MENKSASRTIGEKSGIAGSRGRGEMRSDVAFEVSAWNTSENAKHNVVRSSTAFSDAEDFTVHDTSLVEVVLGSVLV